MKRLCAALVLVLLIGMLSGCELKLPEIHIPFLSSDPIICVVTAKESHSVTAEVQREDSHYDEGDTLYINYQNILGGNTLNVGDQITFEYDYMNKVTVKNDDPLIEVDTIEITHWDPPETTEAKD